MREKIKGPEFPAQYAAFGVDLRSEKKYKPEYFQLSQKYFSWGTSRGQLGKRKRTRDF